MNRELSIILFDLGGVLVELPAQPIPADWTDRAPASGQKSSGWLTSPAATAFEKGEISASRFADEIVKEMKLSITPDEILARFTFWPKGLFPGTKALIGRIPPQYTLAIFSNTNELHWPRLMTEMGLEGCFDHYFASFKIGMAKPDPAAFRYVVNALSCEPSEILFLDDSQMNVDAARLVGLKAERVSGIGQVEKVLAENGVLADSSLVLPS
ncbi:MAG: HAD family phosphatase [Deltaproteobacteria bacterium]|nr:HAD family phosphatase [Deltaproteobacteria bacterium]